MWPLPPLRNDIISVIVGPTHLYCGWLHLDAKKELCLSAFARYELESATHIALYHHLANFIKQYQLTNSFISIALCPPIIYQDMISLSNASPYPRDFDTKKLHQLIWDYQYLYTLDDGNHLFYVKGIQKPHYFEYQLLAQKSDLKLIALTSMYAVHLKAYEQWQGKAFRNTKLSVDLAKCKYQIAKCLDRDAIARMIRISAHADEAKNDLEIVAAMIGSYYCQPGGI